jgi:hypothetical protein
MPNALELTHELISRNLRERIDAKLDECSSQELDVVIAALNEDAFGYAFDYEAGIVRVLLCGDVWLAASLEELAALDGSDAAG